MGQRLVELLSAWAVERRRWVLGISFVLAALFAALLPALRVDTSPDALVSSVDGHAEVQRLFRERFGGSNSRLVILVQGPNVLSREALEYQRCLSQNLASLEIVKRVEGLPRVLGESPGAAGKEGDHEIRIEAQLAAVPWVVPLFLSEDREAAEIFVDFVDDEPMDQLAQMKALEAVRLQVKKVRRPEGLEIEMGGVPILSEAIQKKLERDRLTLNPAMMLVALFVLALTFRWWPAVVAPLCAVGIAALGVVGALSFLGVPMSILTNIIPPLLIIVGLSDSVHLLGRYQEELLVERDRLVAGRRAARAMLVACFLTSLTTAVGFASLATAETEELGRFGLASAFGVILAYFATVLFVPAFVTLFKPSSERPQGSRSTSHLQRWVFCLTRTVLRRAWWVASLAFLATLGLMVVSREVTVDARLLDAFEESEPVTVLTRKMESKLVGIRPLEVMIESDSPLLGEELRSHMRDVAKWVKTRPDVIAATGFFEVVPEEGGEILAPSVLEAHSAWISRDQKAARLTVFFRDSGIRRTLATLAAFEAKLKKGVGASLRVSFTGEAYTGSVGRDSVLRDLISGLGFALVSIFLLLGFLFRSARLALVTIPPNVIPLLATGAYMTLRGIQLNLATVITFSIGIGLAVDDSVHVVARFREESRRISSVGVCLLRAARGTGRAIVVTALSLSGGFSVLLLSEFISVRQFGELIAFTVFACLVSALIVQPALLYLAVRRR